MKDFCHKSLLADLAYRRKEQSLTQHRYIESNIFLGVYKREDSQGDNFGQSEVAMSFLF